ncbi:MAG: hypothetical protein GC162_10580 [Planctomycetes bacterium]|nr:hypothetical protein [Planctomycetota bacterium]
MALMVMSMVLFGGCAAEKPRRSQTQLDILLPLGLSEVLPVRLLGSREGEDLLAVELPGPGTVEPGRSVEAVIGDVTGRRVVWLPPRVKADAATGGTMVNQDDYRAEFAQLEERLGRRPTLRDMIRGPAVEISDIGAPPGQWRGESLAALAERMTRRATGDAGMLESDEAMVIHVTPDEIQIVAMPMPRVPKSGHSPASSNDPVR